MEHMILLSFSGTFRLILILLIVLLILRILSRSGKGNSGGTNWGKPDDRSKGEVRIERAGDEQRRGQGPVEDADFEEVK